MQLSENSSNLFRGSVVLLFLFVLGLIADWPVEAANPALVAPAANVPAAVTGALVPFAEVASNAPELVLALESVKLSVRRVAGAQAISIASNCPAHWNVSGNVVRQVGFSTTQKGVSLRADSTGAIAIVNGRIYQLPREADGSLRSIQMKDGEVVINGRKLEPLAGSDKPGACTGPDQVEVRVPDGYAGGLVLSVHGASTVQVDGWQGGSVMASLQGESSLVTGKLQGLAKAVVDVQGSGSAQIKGLSAKAFVANINGSGSVVVDSGSAELSNATVTGSGTMTLKGKFKNLKQSVTGTGQIQVKD